MSAVQGQQYTFMFPAVDASSPGVRLNSPTFSAGDAVQTKPGGTPTATTNTPTHLGGGRCQLVLTAAEMGLGLAAGEVGEFHLDIAHAGMVPLLGVTIEVQATAPGVLTAAERAATAAAAAAAVGGLVVETATEGARTLIGVLRLISARFVNKAQVPMAGTGGVISGRDGADTKNRLEGTISSTGAITWTTVDPG
jgi:hypothetical protein